MWKVSSSEVNAWMMSEWVNELWRALCGRREREENEALNRVVHQRHQQDPFQSTPQLPLEDIKMQAPPVIKPPEQPAAVASNRDAIRRSRELERRRRAEVCFLVALCVSVITSTCVSVIILMYQFESSVVPLSPFLHLCLLSLPVYVILSSVLLLSLVLPECLSSLLCKFMLSVLFLSLVLPECLSSLPCMFMLSVLFLSSVLLFDDWAAKRQLTS